MIVDVINKMKKRCGGLPWLTQLSVTEQNEYYELIAIVQNVTGIEHIANRAEVMHDETVKPLLSRIRHLISKDLISKDKVRSELEMTSYQHYLKKSK